MVPSTVAPTIDLKEIQGFQRKSTLSTKMLSGVGLILLISIFFISFSMIFILIEDKKLYTYQNQLLESELFGKHLVTKLNSVAEQQRASLLQCKPSGCSPLVNSKFKNYLKDQSDILAMSVLTFGLKPLVQIAKSKEFLSLTLKSSDLQKIKKKLLATGQAVTSVQGPEEEIFIAVVQADLRFRTHPMGMPLAVAFLRANSSGIAVKNSDVFIGDKEGNLIFASKNLTTPLAQDPFFLTATEGLLTSGVKEFKRDGVRTLGSFHRPGLDLVVLTEIAWTRAMKSAFGLMEKCVLLAGIALGVAILFSLLFSKTVTVPINHIYQATSEISSGRFDVSIPIQSKDEIGALANSFVLMSRKIKELIAESVKKAQLESEIAIVATVQRDLFPDKVVKTNRVQIHSFFESASQCGGDWWGWFGDERKLTMFVGDATGHGLPPALLTASARGAVSILQSLSEAGGESLDPKKCLSLLNRSIHDSAKAQMMMTMFASVFDFEAKTVAFSNAAHVIPMVLRKQADGPTVSFLSARGNPLGGTPELGDIEGQSFEFKQGDVMVFFTDGLIEAADSDGQQYGKKRLRNLLIAAPQQKAEPILASIVEDLKNHAGDKPFNDDVTIVVLEIS